MIQYIQATENDLHIIQQLLHGYNLPSSDLVKSKVEFIIAKEEGTLIGCIGLERYGTIALLRSFAVQTEYRNKGFGRELFQRMIKYASQNKVYEIHLLTTTAKDYFNYAGFKEKDRKDAPDSIKQSIEFSELCPSSSTYMVLEGIN